MRIPIFSFILFAALQLVAVADGSKMAKHKERLQWIWEPPQRSVLPAVSDDVWPVVAADYFVLARLDAEKLSPAPAATRANWIRRVTFALVGLPPTPEDVDAFVSDDAPDELAKETVVDRLLASPHFGERWARHWMDLVRYAESRGHESDYVIANAFHYRNYLINALNADLPYDRFVTEHLAGDLVPDPRRDPVTGANESILATGWPFLGEEVHSPVDIRSDECDRMDNKIDVMSKAFLGLTVACARCHDHKFDAISQKDYYSMAGFVLSSSYRQVRFESMEHNREQSEKLWRLRDSSRVDLLRSVVKEINTEIAPALLSALEGDEKSAWRTVLDAAEKDPMHVLHPIAKKGAQAQKAADQRVLVDYSDPEELWRPDGHAFGPRAVAAGDLLFGDDSKKPLVGIATQGSARFDPVWKVLESTPDNESDSGTIETSKYAGRMIRTRTVTLGSGKVHYLIRGKARVYAGVDSHIMLAGPLHGKLVQKYGIRGEAGLRWVSHDLSAYAGHRTHFEFSPLENGDTIEVLKVVESDAPPALPIIENKFIADGASAGSSAAVAGVMEAVFRIVVERMRVGMLEEAHVAQLADFVVRNPKLFGANPAGLPEFGAKQLEIQSGIQARSRTAVSWLDGSGVDENLLARGKHQEAEDACDRGLPVAFENAKPIETRDTSGRLEFARQIVDASNPLTGRVVVNRVWHHLFGRGIVATTDNFGWLGERPTHPELLDHLAHDFVHRHEWSMKSLIRELVLSRAFGMSSRPDDAMAETADPQNKLLHRMPLRRLEGEALRDAVLAVSGRLDRAMLGKPVPVHLTEFVIGRGRPSQSGPLDGAGRRSIYTSVRRNFLPTLMLTFDTPTPFSAVGRRTVTNVPAQSLALMNDDFIYEQAGIWAVSVKEGGGDEGSRVVQIFRTALGRVPTEGEVETCRATLADLRAESGDEQGAWKELCHAVFSLNEFLYVP